MDGYGSIVYANGETYDGQFSEDKIQGYGVYKWTDGRKYTGKWKQGK